jgi:hypothetical protein
MGAGFAIVASALLLVSVFDAMAKLRSVDTREELTKALDSAAARGLGVSLDQATDVLHGLLLISGGGAAVAAVLAVFAMLGHAAARTMLTVLAVVVLLCSAPVDPMLGVVLALGAGMLWSQPARDWFAGRTPVPAAAGAAAASAGAAVGAG